MIVVSSNNGPISNQAVATPSPTKVVVNISHAVNITDLGMEQLPKKYARRQLSPEEIDAINMGGI